MDPEIKNKYLFMREILIRLIAYSVSNNVNIRDEGEKLLEVARDFIEKINLKGLTSEKRPVLETVSNALKTFTSPNFSLQQTTFFGKELTVKIEFWFDLIKNHIEVSKILYANKNACARSLQFLEDVRLLTQRQIIILFSDRLKLTTISSTADYHDELLDLTFTSCMAKLELEVEDQGTLTFQSSNMIQLEEQLQKVTNKVESLQLSLLDKSLLIGRIKLLSTIKNLSFLLQKIECLIIALNWFPVISGTLNFNVISAKIGKLRDDAANILNLNSMLANDPNFLSDTAFEILKKYSSLNCSYRLIEEGFKSSISLKKVGTDEMTQQLLFIMGKDINDILVLQEMMGIQVIAETRMSNILPQNNYGTSNKSCMFQQPSLPPNNQPLALTLPNSQIRKKK